MRLSEEDTTARVCAGLFVLALHLVVLILALTTSRNRREAASDSRALTLINIAATEQKLPKEQGDQKCMLPIGKREARGDLFESIEKK
jgi:hypothetical protein